MSSSSAKSSTTRPSKPSSKLRTRDDLFDYQIEAAARLVKLERAACFLKPGLGKTAITLTALMDTDVTHVLVIAPAPIVERDVWGREAGAWRHTGHLSVMPLVGTPAQRLDKMHIQRMVEVISYENAIWLTDQVDLTERYDAIVFDELSKVKAPGTARFKRLRHRAMDIPFRVGLTGSPVGNKLLDLWGEMFMATGPAALGGTFSGFRDQYFCPSNPHVPVAQQSWELKHPSLEKEIHDRVKPHSFSLDAKLAADRLPEVRVAPIDLPLPKSVRATHDTLAQECIAQLGDGKEIRALGASSLATKVRQLASGAVYSDGGREAGTWSEVHSVKIDALREIVDEQQGEPLLVFYWYAHELARLAAAFPRARLATDPMALLAWDRREVPVLLAHPQSAGHGLNLQLGGSSVCWFTLPWSHELWEQGNGRLARVGQAAPFVTAIPLLCGDADRAVLAVLREKESVQDRLIEAVKL